MDAKTISVLLVACMFVCMFEGASGSTRAELVKLYFVYDDCLKVKTRMTDEECKKAAELVLTRAPIPEPLAEKYEKFMNACATCCHEIYKRSQANIDNNVCYCLNTLPAEAKQLFRQKAAVAA